MKPDISFFVIGGARCGTTSLYKALREHPEIYAPELKEPRFFKENWDKGWRWYAAQYAGTPPGAVCGDFSPSYSNSSVSDTVPLRIARAYPSTRIIYMVRNPIDCAISNWRMTAELTNSTIAFGDALTDESWSAPVLYRTMFWRQLSLFRKHFSDDQILTFPLEMIRDQPQEMFENVFRHLGVASVPLEFSRSNFSSQKPNRPDPPEISFAERKAYLDLVKENAECLLEHLSLPRDYWTLSVDYEGWGRRSMQDFSKYLTHRVTSLFRR